MPISIHTDLLTQIPTAPGLMEAEPQPLNPLPLAPWYSICDTNCAKMLQGDTEMNWPDPDSEGACSSKGLICETLRGSKHHKNVFFKHTFFFYF